MAQKRKTSQSKVILEAALALAGGAGWQAVTLRDVARRAKLDLKTVESHFPDTWKILEAVLRGLNASTEAEVAGSLASGPWRDNLFEVLMTRFDLMQDRKKAFASVPSALRKRPKTAARFLPLFHDSMRGLLNLAGAPEGPLHTFVFGALYLLMFEEWKKDATPDLAKTMAAVDKRLDMFEKALPYLSCPPGRGVKAAA